MKRDGKAIAEKEEANAEVEAAKTEVADLWKEHDYLTSANRTKVERSNRLLTFSTAL